MAAQRWLLYTVNGEGLGHLTRMLSLARQLRRLAPKVEILFLTSCEAINLAWQEGFASLKVPSGHAVRRGQLRPGTHIRLLQTVVPHVTALFNPDVLVVDTFPAGSLQELLPVLQWPLRRALIYREQKKEQCASAWFQGMLAQYPCILVPHAAGTVECPAPSTAALEFVGPMLLRSRSEALPRAEARWRLGLPAEGLVVYVGFGGGGDTAYLQLQERVLEQAAHFPEYHFACAVPPLQQMGVKVPALPNVSTFRYWPLAECWTAFDGAVAAVGYNSATELLHHGVPTIWVPLDKNSDDQHLRARRAVEQGAGWLALQAEATALQTALRELGDAGRRSAVAEAARALVPVNGAERAAAALLGWVGSATGGAS